MLELDTTTITLSTALIFLSIITPMISISFRKFRNRVEESEEGFASCPPLSVVVTSYNNAEELKQVLPHILSQKYTSEFEVIIVTDMADKASEDVINRFCEDKRVRSTFLPTTSRYMSKYKLAITLGVKAAKNDWVALIDTSCTPHTDQWLTTMARNCKEDINIVMGYSAYGEDVKSYLRFAHIYKELYLLRKAQQSIAYTTDSRNILFRKSAFLAENGFQGNLKFAKGEYDFLINKFAQYHSTAIESDEDGWLIENPTHKEWLHKQLYYQETRRHLFRSAAMRAVFNMDMTVLYFNYIAIIIVTGVALREMNTILLSATALAMVITLTLRIIFTKKAFRRFDTNISFGAIIPFELSIIWHHLYYRVKYLMTNRNSFITHKI